LFTEFITLGSINCVNGNAVNGFSVIIRKRKQLKGLFRRYIQRNTAKSRLEETDRTNNFIDDEGKLFSMKFKKLVISEPSRLMFGHAQKPVTTRRGLVIGGGTVYPEFNFTLPSMEVTMETLNDVKTHYTDTVRGALEKAHHRGLTC
jgi:hypothetical protein